MIKSLRPLIFFIGVLLSACTKEELQVVPNNTPPPDPTINESLYRQFVVRSYVSLLGEAPLPDDLIYQIERLKSQNFSDSSRSALLD